MSTQVREARVTAGDDASSGAESALDGSGEEQEEEVVIPLPSAPSTPKSVVTGKIRTKNSQNEFLLVHYTTTPVVAAVP